MHINSPLINVTSSEAKKEGQEEERVCREGETRREDIRVGEAEGERHTEQMTRRTFGRASQRPRALLGDF